MGEMKPRVNWSRAESGRVKIKRDGRRWRIMAAVSVVRWTENVHGFSMSGGQVPLTLAHSPRRRVRTGPGIPVSLPCPCIDRGSWEDEPGPCPRVREIKKQFGTWLAPPVTFAKRGGCQPGSNFSRFPGCGSVGSAPWRKAMCTYCV